MRPVSLHQSGPGRYTARAGRDRNVAVLSPLRRDDQDRALYVVSLYGVEIGTARTVVQVRELIEAAAAGSALEVAA